MSTATRNRFLSRLVKRYPVQAGIIFIMVAAFMAYDSMQRRTKYEEFVGGDRIDGYCRATSDDFYRRPRYIADVEWVSPNSRSYRGNVEINQYLYRELKSGSRLPLLLSTVNPNVAASAKVLDNLGIVKIGGVSFSDLVYGFPLMAGIGLTVILLRKRLIAKANAESKT